MTITDPLHIVSFIFNKFNDDVISLTCDVTIHEDFTYRLADISVVFEWLTHNQTITPELTFTANNITATAIVKDGGVYSCMATIDGISKSRTVTIEATENKRNASDQLKHILLGGLGVVAILCLVMCSLLFFICCHCPQKSGSTIYSNMLSKTKIGARLSTNSCASADFVFNKPLVSDNSLQLCYDVFLHLTQSKISLLSSEWTVPYDTLQFDCTLGSGAFGTVRKAYMMTGVGHKTPVAVKTLQCNVL